MKASTKQTMEFRLANLTEADVRFLEGIKALFSDPSRAQQLELVRERQLRLAYTGDHPAKAGLELRPAQEVIHGLN